jgi:alpha-glucosidase (family GH31 glycosyl hydrolase)
MFAGKLKVSPILTATNGQSTFDSYFPKGQWVNMADFKEIINGNDNMQKLTVRDTVNVHLAPGALISFQDNSDMSIMTTQDTLKKPIMLVINRDTDNKFAHGTLFLDQGVSKAEIDHEDWEYYRIYAQANSI